MVFSSLVFLYFYFPLALILYYAMPSRKLKNFVLTALSLVFYAWGEPVWVILLVISSMTDFIVGKAIEKNRGNKYAKYALIASITINIGFLAVFKYSGMIVSSINAVTPFNFPVPDIALPIGISFYTFQTLSYTIDVYKNKARVQHSFMDFLLFVSLFPQLIAGPILRYTDIDEQIAERTHSFEKMSQGITRFVIGLSKKIIIANHAGEVVGQFLDFNRTAPSTLSVWYGVFMFAIQIYFDFSGYSDMAIGLGKMFGFDYSENFNYPYIASTITDFWRRWHISLSSFFKDYIYIPLGGNRRYQIRNIAIVWLLTGIWHGASWNFALWGVFYGVMLIFEKLVLLKFFKMLPSILSKIVSRIYSVFIILVGWCLFYFTGADSLLTAFAAMFTPTGNSGDFILTQSIANNAFFILIAVIASTPLPKKAAGYIAKLCGEKLSAAAVVVNMSFNAACIFLCTALLTSQSYNPFLYFRF